MPGVPLRNTSRSASLQGTNIALRPPTAEELLVTSQGPPDQAQGLNGATQLREKRRSAVLGFNEQSLINEMASSLGGSNGPFLQSYQQSSNMASQIAYYPMPAHTPISSHTPSDWSSIYTYPPQHPLMQLPEAMNPMPPTSHAMTQPGASPNNTAEGDPMPRPASTMPLNKAREKYYMTAADPSRDRPSRRTNE
jgi:hypothetical protein